MDHPEKMKTTKNWMTRETEKRLQKSLAEAEENQKKALLAIGEGAGPNSDWHDNFPFEQANRDFEFYSSAVSTIKKRLSNHIIIRPREETRDIGIGNEVKIKFEDQSQPEIFTILGVNDPMTQNNWISYESPLGANLIGKRCNEIAEFLVNNGKKRALILEIRQGKFRF